MSTTDLFVLGICILFIIAVVGSVLRFIEIEREYRDYPGMDKDDD